MAEGPAPYGPAGSYFGRNAPRTVHWDHSLLHQALKALGRTLHPVRNWLLALAGEELVCVDEPAAKYLRDTLESAWTFVNPTTLHVTRVEQALKGAEAAACLADVDDEVLANVYDAIATAQAELDEIRAPEHITPASIEGASTNPATTEEIHG